METLRLQKLQAPSMVSRLLEELVTRAPLVPEHCYQLRDPQALPVSLRDLIRSAEKSDRAWSAWTDDHRIWLFTAEMQFATARERGSPVLQVTRYTESGELLETELWTCDRLGAWVKCLV